LRRCPHFFIESGSARKEKSMSERKLYMQSALRGGFLGTVFGGVFGAATGALSGSWAGAQAGAALGALCGALVGMFTGALVVRTAGSTGGVSMGAYSGMALGAALGFIFGILLPDSFRAGVFALGSLLLNTLVQARFETGAFVSFELSLVGMGAGGWVGGKNLRKR